MTAVLPRRCELDGWAITLNAGTDAEAAAAVRRLCQRVNDASCELLELHGQLRSCPWEDVADSLRKAGGQADRALTFLVELRRAFERHERGNW